MSKKVLLKFIRKFYDPNLSYVEKILDEWLKNSVRFVIDVIFTGIIFYVVLAGLITIIPGISLYIFLGNPYWIPLMILYLGIIRWFFEDVYKFLRKGGK